MKFFKLFIISTALMILSSYILLFTDIGNSILKPIVESEISKVLQTPISFKKFLLKPKIFQAKLISNDGSTIEVDCSFNMFTQSFNLLYDIKINDLTILENLIGKRLNGLLKTEGTIKGDRYVIHIDGKSDIANSNTFYTVKLKNLEPESFKLNAKHLQIDRLLYMLNKPIYSNGTADIKADITNLDFEELYGKVLVNIINTTLNPEPIKRKFEIIIPSDIKIDAEVKSQLKGTKAISSLNLNSTINKLHSKAIVYDLKRNSLTADYEIELPDLDKLYFLTNRHMQGDITFTGNIEVTDNLVKTTAHADTLGGVVDLLLKNDNLNINVKNIQTIALTDMLLYPHIFDSRTNVKLNYNLTTKKGELYIDSFDGEFLPNKMSFLIKEYTNFDITKEIYEHTVLESTIYKKILYSNLHMKSRYTEISSKKASIDFKNDTINAKLNIKIKNSNIPIYLKGKLQQPSIKVEANKLIKKKVYQEIKKRLPEKIKESPLKDLIKSLF